ncbi:MAG: PAS domain S-box protein, partial [Candidatus Eremiobacteraeota bacterium]|nr:PAS domain S-box protein [Candidatus Eremiobacteraeota bacterium]
MARITLDGIIVEANQALIKRSGFSRDQLEGRHAREFASAPSRHFVDELVNELAQGHTSFRELHLVHKQGAVVPRRFTVVPSIVEGALVSGFLVIQDITERVHAQELMRSLFSHHPHGIATIDPTGKVLEVNDALMAMSGYRRRELLGANIIDFAGPETAGVLADFVQQTLSGTPQSAEFRPYRKDGTRGFVQLTTIPMQVEDEVVGVYLVFQDIEKQKHSQETLHTQSALLRESEERFRSLFVQNPDGVVVLDRDGTIIDANEPLLVIGGYPRDQVIGQNFRSLVSDDELHLVAPYIERVLAGETVHYQFTLHSPHTGERHLKVTSFPVQSADKDTGIYAIVVDATAEQAAQKLAEAQAKRIRELYLIAASANIADSQIVNMLETGCRLLGMETAAIIDATNDCKIEHRFTTHAVESGDEGESLIAIASEVMATLEPVMIMPARQLRGRYRSGIGVPLRINGLPFGALVFASSSADRVSFAETDIDLVALMSALLGSALERRRSRANLKTLAYFDALTGLPNRVFFQERLRDAVESAQTNLLRVAVIFFDLDRFKDVNDTLGHALGDRLLQLVAGRLVETVAHRGIVARMGGDEFVVLLPNCESLDEVRHTAEELLSAIDGSYTIDEYEQFITASAGISVYPDDGKDDQTLIKNADIAMYRAKDLGSNAYQLYAPSFEANIQMRLSQEKLIRRALEHEEFVVHYQPQVDMLTGRIVAHEALVRWNHPKTGIIFPARFIPSAEVSGLIVPLGDFVLRKATEQTRIWQKQYPGLRIAVNLSAKQFHQPDLRSSILSALQAAHLDP